MSGAAVGADDPDVGGGLTPNCRETAESLEPLHASRPAAAVPVDDLAPLGGDDPDIVGAAAPDCAEGGEAGAALSLDVRGYPRPAATGVVKNGAVGANGPNVLEAAPPDGVEVLFGAASLQREGEPARVKNGSSTAHGPRFITPSPDAEEVVALWAWIDPLEVRKRWCSRAIDRRIDRGRLGGSVGLRCGISRCGISCWQRAAPAPFVAGAALFTRRERDENRERRQQVERRSRRSSVFHDRAPRGDIFVEMVSKCNREGALITKSTFVVSVMRCSRETTVLRKGAEALILSAPMKRTRRAAVIASLILCGACGHNEQPGASTAREPLVDGWEGFYSWATVDAAWLEGRGVPLELARIRGVFDRVGKLVIAGQERSAPEEELRERQTRYCGDDEQRRWNEALCRELEGRDCDGETCRYQHVGNCSGLFIGGGLFLTAAHCVAELAADDELHARSSILRSDADGHPSEPLELGDIVLGKRDFDHHWSVEDPSGDPVDVAVIRVDDGGLASMTRGALPPVGSPVFIAGFPRVERRSEEARGRVGYELVFGTPSLSFGRLADRNEADYPLCNVDGDQEHWRLVERCDFGEVEVGGEQTWRGVITNSPFLATYDTSNGYSGGPVFDQEGRLIGVNVTLIGRFDPQERYSADTRVVAIPVEHALHRLGVVAR